MRYQVLAHFEWNDQREELAGDRDENKHHNIAMRSVRQGGRRDIFLGARECQAYVKPCEFGGGEGFYDSYGEWNMGYMFHGFSYPDENPDHNLISRFWTPIMEDGVIRFESPDSPLLDRHIVRHGLNVKESTGAGARRRSGVFLQVGIHSIGTIFQQHRRLVSNRNCDVGIRRPFLPSYLVMRACSLR